MSTNCPLPAGPGLFELLGQGARLRGDPLRLLVWLHQRYGDAAATRLGGRSLVAEFSPAAHRAVLVDQQTSFVRYHRASARRLYPDDLERLDGERHAKARRWLAPAYGRAHLDGHFAALRELVERELERWPPGATVDLPSRLTPLVQRLLVRAMLGLEFGDDFDAVHQVIGRIRRRTSTPSAFLRELWPAGLPWSNYQQRRRSVRQLEALFERAQRRGPVAPRHRLAPELARTHATVSLPGGAGVTAAAAVWALYLLARHPVVGRKLRAELEGRPVVTADELHTLAYLDQVVKECLRLYANVVILPRVALGETEVAGHRVPAGALVGLFPYVLHRRADLFEQPNSFRPERFDPDDGQPLAPFSYLPFGAGSHVCLGQHLAVLVLKLLLVSILQRYHPALAPGEALRERQIVTQEINLRLWFELSPAVGASRRRMIVFGDLASADSARVGPDSRSWEKGD